MSRYEFDKEKAYRLVDVLDKEGRDKSSRSSFYADRLNCVAVNLRYDKRPVYGTTDSYRIKMTYVRNVDGQPVQRSLHTSVVHGVEETEEGLKIYTENSVYFMEATTVKEIEPLEEANLIQLYLSMEEDNHFAAGFYYDAERKAHELCEFVHLGMIVDSVLIGTYEQTMYDCYVCRYFLRNDCIEFYDTIYGQQDYSTPMLIHNTGKSDLIIRFEDYPKVWTIKPYGNKRIMPFHPEGADTEEE